MKILAFTAGAAQMYCGSCIRDNALAAELLKQGHDCILVPLYTPTLTDEQNVSGPHVFFGGISVYLEQYWRIFRRTPWLLDRLWDSHWALDIASRRSIAVSPKLLGEMTVSMLRGEQGFQRKEIQKLTAWLHSEAPPDLVTLPNSLLIGLARPIADTVKRPVYCTLQGEDLFLSMLEEPYKTTALELIRAKVSDIDGFMAVSDYYAEFMCRHLRIPERKMHVVPLGINLDGCGPKTHAESGSFKIGYFARVAPEKGLHLLVESYLRLRTELDFGQASLEVAGYLAPEHREYLTRVGQRMKDSGLGGEFHYHGVLDRGHKIDFLRSLDVLSVPSTYDEPKGIFLLEAMANGVPVVQPRRGAFPEMLSKTGGGILVEPDDAVSLAEGLLRLRKDTELRAALGRQGAEGVREHYSVSKMTARALQVFTEIAAARAYA